MKKPYLCFFSLILLCGSTSSFKVYDWRRDFGDSSTTQEFAQLHEDRQHILHSAVDTAGTSFVPVISFMDFNFTATKFEKGILAMRPLMTDGNQLCFISRLKTKWDDALSTLQSRRKGRCRGIICPRDHYTLENQCVPLYDTLRGLDINIRIQITPNLPIPARMSKDFVESLKNMADKALNDTVELERRQVSLWKLPRSDKNPTPYYLLDMFLFSPSNVIQFSAAIEQAKQFLRTLQEEGKRAVPRPPNIKLDIQFKHGLHRKRNAYIDVIKDKTLKPLMGKGWSFIEPGPYMAISDVNWCYRAAVGFNEIEDYIKFIRVTSTDITAFLDQYDFYENNIYICVDLFIEQKNVKGYFDINREVKAAAENDSAVSKEIDAERGLILTVSVIAVILLLVIMYRVKHFKAKKRSLRPVESNYGPEDIELNDVKNVNTSNNIKLNIAEFVKNRNNMFVQGNKTSDNHAVETK